MHIHAASAYSCHLVFPSALSTPSTGCIGSEGQDWKPQKTVCVSVAWFLFQTSPLAPLVPPTFLSPPSFFSHFPLSLSPALNFPSPSLHPSSPACLPACLPRSSSHIGDAEGLYVWFWAQMALACLWRWIKPPVSPFASMCKWSGQRTSNRGKGGRNARREKKKQNPPEL